MRYIKSVLKTLEATKRYHGPPQAPPGDNTTKKQNAGKISHSLAQLEGIRSLPFWQGGPPQNVTYIFEGKTFENVTYIFWKTHTISTFKNVNYIFEGPSEIWRGLITFLR